MDTKYCKGCKLDKPFSEFRNKRESKDGKAFKCKACVIALDALKPNCIADDCKFPEISSIDHLCSTHHTRMKKHGDITIKLSPPGAKPKDQPSEWKLQSNGYVARHFRGVVELQHRAVMEDFLDRKLVAGENVHHINGDRADNRLENLELWNTIQPAGQRAADKVAYAIEILKLYSPDLLK